MLSDFINTEVAIKIVLAKDNTPIWICNTVFLHILSAQPGVNNECILVLRFFEKGVMPMQMSDSVYLYILSAQPTVVI